MKVKYFLFLLILPVIQYSQSKVILRPDGKIIKPGRTQEEIQPVSKKLETDILRSKSSAGNITQGFVDTLSYGVWPGVNFGFFGQDRMLQWFEAPADMEILAIGFNVSQADPHGTQVEVKLTRSNWSKEDLLNAGVQRWGYYPAEGNGYNNATAFLDDPDRTGEWVNVSGTEKPEIFGSDLWSDNGDGFPVTPAADGEYQWVNLDLLGFGADVKKGEIFGVVLRNMNPKMDSARIGFYADNLLGIPGFKYYANGRLDRPNDFGWWSRKYTWDFVLSVNLTGDVAPYITGVTIFGTTANPGARTVHAEITDINPSGGPAGVAEAWLHYSTDRVNFTAVPMTADGNIYSAEIPGNLGVPRVDYYVSAEDVQGNVSESKRYFFNIIILQSENLLVFNGFTSPSGFPQSYYFGHDDFVNKTTLQWDHDVWAYGKLTPELLDNYKNVFEITTFGPDEINNDAIAEWLAADGSRNYFLAGDDWLGAQSNWPDSLEHFAGEFHYDILGIEKEYNDINYFGTEVYPELPSIVQPVQSSLLGDSLYNLFRSIGDTMWYNPYYEINVKNWLDGVKFRDDVEVDMMGLGGTGKWYPIAGHRTLPAGNKIVFLAYDPLSLDAPDSQYYWYGFSSAAPQVQTLRWFGINLTKAENESEVIPDEFKLYQNYPNPFNPVTTIKFSIPVETPPTSRGASQPAVQLKIYDILGREIATLVNKKLQPGTYDVTFDGNNLPSGVYIYRLQTNNKTLSGKMLLLK